MTNVWVHEGFDPPPPFYYMAVTLAMEASHRCVHGNSYSFHPLPRAYGNEYELVWWFDSTLCYCVVRKLLTRGIARKVFLWTREVILEGSIPSTSLSSISYYTLSSFMKSV